MFQKDLQVLYWSQFGATTEPTNKRRDKMADKVKAEAKKVLTLASVEAGIAELVTDGIVAENVAELISKGLVKAELDEVEVEAGKFSGDYVRFSVGENAKSDKQVIAALTAICGGFLNFQPDTAEGAEEGSIDTRKPCVVKFTLYGADLNARSRTSQRIKALAEGPEKAIEKMADNMQKAKPGKWTREQAIEIATMMLSDDDETATTDAPATE